MQFIVDAYREPEGVVRLELDADSAGRASEIVGGDGYDVLDVREGTRARFRLSLRSRNTFSVPHFSRELLMLLEAGLGIVEIVDLLQRKSRDAAGRVVLESLHTALRHGRTLSDAMESRPDVFSPLFVATVRSSERTSNLVEALKRYLAYHDRMSALKAKIVSASIYPAIVLAAGGLVVVFLMTYVVPRFAGIYEDIGGDMPLLSRLLMAWGQFFGNHAVLVCAALAALICAGIYGLSSERLRKRLLAAIWRWPAVGTLGITDKALLQSHADMRAGLAAAERASVAAVKSGPQTQSLAKGTAAAGIDLARMQSDPAYAAQMQKKMASMSDAEKMQMAMQFNSAYQQSQAQTVMQNQAGFSAGIELSSYAAQAGETMANLDRQANQRLADMTQRYDARHKALDDGLRTALQACPLNAQCSEAGCDYDPQCLRSLDARVPDLIAQHRKLAEAELGEFRKLYGDVKGPLQPVVARTAELARAAETAGSGVDHLGLAYGQLGGAALRLQTIDARAALRAGFWAGIKPRTIKDSLSVSGPLGYGYALAGDRHVDTPPDLPRGW